MAGSQFCRWTLSLLASAAVGQAMPAQQPVATNVAPRASVANGRVTINVDTVPLRVVLESIAQQAGLSPGYSPDLPALNAKVSLHVQRVPAVEAFEMVLRGTDVSATIQPTGYVIFVRRGAEGVELGGVAGIVTGGKTRRAIAGASVLLDDSVKSVHTDEAGHYRLVGVASGAHRVTVRSVGYARQSRMVTVADDQTTTVNFALEGSVNTLDQVVVTATGAQRYRELGHVVTQINADSLVREAPITSLSELLTARVPGLQVFSGNGGTVGGEIALRLRGQTTTALDPQPIVIVDGVRYKNTNVLDQGDGNLRDDVRPFNAEPRSPLNDLNVNDIASIEVVKGPSASTLYGPDAANGVIVITTKRGNVGKAVWHVYAYPDLSVVPKTDGTSMSAYRAWGHNPHTGVLYTANCALPAQAQPNPQCVLDSITVVPTLSNSDQYGVIAKTRPQWHSGASVSGGASTFTYFFSGNYDSEIGALQLSPFAEQVLKTQLGTQTLSDAIKNPNTQQALTLHTSVSSQVNAVSTLSFVANYTQAAQRAVSIPNIYKQTFQTGVFRPGLDTTNLTQVRAVVPINAFLQTTQQQVRRLTASASGTTRPVSWLTVTADVGTDVGTSVDRGVEQVGAEGTQFAGIATDYRRENTGRSADLGTTATAHPGVLSFRSSVGVQYTYANLDGLNSYGTGLAPGSTSITTAANKGLAQRWSETASLGTYGEEVMGIADRLFLTGSIRLDGSTSFGDAYHPRPFPKVGASWIVSDEPFFNRARLLGVNELRLRYSYGAASRYPTSYMKYGEVDAGNATFSGKTQTLFDRSVLSNPLVRPERTREAEFGADATLVSNIQLGLTWYTRRTDDQLARLTVPYGYLSQWANVGVVKADGFEATMSATLIESRRVSVHLQASCARNTDKVLSLGSATAYQTVSGSLVAGYPLDAAFGRTVVSVMDTAGGGPDSIAAGSEIVLSPVHYLGVLYPPNVVTITPSVLLFGGHVRISALFDRQTGGVERNTYMEGCGGTGLCVAGDLKTTPLVTQANILDGSAGPSLVSSDFTRWRELSMTSDLPSAWRQRLWLSRASVSLQVRNLALWTSYRGTDPESVPGLGTIGHQSAFQGATGIPQTRSWAVRFDISP